jgi:hypothetical protein
MQMTNSLRDRAKVWLGRGYFLCLASIILAGYFVLSPPLAPSSAHSRSVPAKISLRQGLDPREKLTAYVDERNLGKALLMYSELTGREILPLTNSPLQRLDRQFGNRLTKWHIVKRAPAPDTGISYHRDGRFSAGEIKEQLETLFHRSGIRVVPHGANYLRVLRAGQGARFSTES